jgi:hypothetical protein
MPFPDLKEGDVFFLDLTDHTGKSANTMKDPHKPRKGCPMKKINLIL